MTAIDERPSSLEIVTTSIPAARSSSANVCRNPRGHPSGRAAAGRTADRAGRRPGCSRDRLLPGWGHHRQGELLALEAEGG